MALSETQKRKIEEEEKYRLKIATEEHAVAKNTSSSKNGIPALLSFFIPGVGQMVKGQVGRGILILIATVIGYMFLVIPGLVIHIWQITDAYKN